MSGPTQVPVPVADPPRTRLSRSLAASSKRLTRNTSSSWWWAAVHPVWSFNPTCATPAGLTRSWFGLAPVRSPLLRGFFCFLGVHEMFQFPRFPPACAGLGPQAKGLPHSEIVRSLAARASRTLFAALPRPSSARSAKASTVCSFCLPGRVPWLDLQSRPRGRTHARTADLFGILPRSSTSSVKDRAADW